MTQLALDLFGDQARADARRGEREQRRADFLARHQIGQVRLPWDTADGRKAGELVPAWVCCHCHTVELGEYPLWINHGCNESERASYPCRRTKPRWNIAVEPAQ